MKALPKFTLSELDELITNAERLLGIAKECGFHAMARQLSAEIRDAKAWRATLADVKKGSGS
jgi:hypothetical protein